MISERTILCVTGITGAVICYTVYAFTHPSINGIALASVLGAIGVLAGVGYRGMVTARENLEKATHEMEWMQDAMKRRMR